MAIGVSGNPAVFSLQGFIELAADAAIAKAKSFGKTLESVADSSSKAFDKIDAVFTHMANSIVAAKARDFATAIGSATIQTQDFRAALTSITKSASEADKILNKISDFAAKSPFDFPDVARAAIQFKAMGFEIDENLTLAGNLASAFNRDLKTAVEGITKTLSGAAEGVEILRNNFGLSNAELKRLGVSFDKNNAIVIKGTADIERMRQAIKKFADERAFDAMAIRSKTLGGVLSNTSDELFRTAAAIGEKLSPALIAGAEWVQRMAKSFRELPDGVKTGVGAIGFFIAGVTSLIGILGPLAFLLRQILVLFGTPIKLGGIIVARTAFILLREAIGAAWVGLSSLISVLGAPVTGAVLGLGAAVAIATKTWQEYTIPAEKALKIDEARVQALKDYKAAQKDFGGAIPGESARATATRNALAIGGAADALTAARNTGDAEKIRVAQAEYTRIKKDVHDYEQQLQALIDQSRAIQKKKAEEDSKRRTSTEVKNEIGQIERRVKVEELSRDAAIKRFQEIRKEAKDNKDLKEIDAQLEVKIFELKKDLRAKEQKDFDTYISYRKAKNDLTAQQESQLIYDRYKSIKGNTQAEIEERNRLYIRNTEIWENIRQGEQKLTAKILEIKRKEKDSKLAELEEELKDYRRQSLDKIKVDQYEAAMRKKIDLEDRARKAEDYSKIQQARSTNKQRTISGDLEDLSVRKGQGENVSDAEIAKLREQQRVNEQRIKEEAHLAKARADVEDASGRQRKQIEENANNEILNSRRELDRKIKQIQLEASNKSKDDNIADLKQKGNELETREQILIQLVQQGKALGSDVLNNLKDRLKVSIDLATAEAAREKIGKSAADQARIDKQLQLDILKIKTTAIGQEKTILDTLKQQKEEAKQKEAAARAARGNFTLGGTFGVEGLNASINDDFAAKAKERQIAQEQARKDLVNKFHSATGIDPSKLLEDGLAANTPGGVTKNASELAKQRAAKGNAGNELLKDAGGSKNAFDFNFKFENPDGKTTTESVTSKDLNTKSKQINHRVQLGGGGSL